MGTRRYGLVHCVGVPAALQTPALPLSPRCTPRELLGKIPIGVDRKQSHRIVPCPFQSVCRSSDTCMSSLRAQVSQWVVESEVCERREPELVRDERFASSTTPASLVGLSWRVSCARNGFCCCFYLVLRLPA